MRLYGHANMHDEGQGGPQDLPEARRLYGLAAAQGFAGAQFNLGIMHADGQGGRKDVHEARRLIGLAAAQGHTRALSEAERLANAMAEALLAEEEAEKGKASKIKKKKKKKKSSNQVCLEAKAEAGLAVEAEAREQADAREIEAANALVTAREQEEAEAAQADGQARKQAEQEAEAAAAKAPAVKEAAAAEQPPDDFICPITHGLMIDPVSAADGHTYERRAIEDWLVGHSTSPMTGAKLEVKMLFPNHTVRSFIRTWQEVQRSVRES